MSKMTKWMTLLSEIVFHVTQMASYMEQEKYIRFESPEEMKLAVIQVAEDYTNEPWDDERGMERPGYTDDAGEYAKEKLFEKYGEFDGDTRHHVLAEACLFGGTYSTPAAKYAIRNNVSLLDYDWWVSAMECIQYEMSYEEYVKLSNAIDLDFIELEKDDAPTLLRALCDLKQGKEISVPENVFD